MAEKGLFHLRNVFSIISFDLDSSPCILSIQADES